MRNTVLTLMLYATLLPLGNTVCAQEWMRYPPTDLCFRNSQKLVPGIARAGEYKVVHGPYNSSRNCAAMAHWFTLRTQHGMRWPLTVEKKVGEEWVIVIDKELDPQKKLGAGTFRMVLDNRNKSTPVFYKGSYSVPL